ncbi:MAG: pectinesterase family protein [Flavobacterium sp.]
MRFFFRLLVVFSTWQCFSQNTDVWDFGATQLDGTFNNQLNEIIINSWYPNTISPGTSGVNFPTSFTAGILSWVGNSGDRLRTTNTSLSRFDNNVANVPNFTGRVYCNGNASISSTSGLPTNRFMRLTLAEDDEVTVIARGDTDGLLSFVNEANPSLQTNTFPITSISGQTTFVNFVAQTAGDYRIYDATSKVSFFRIIRRSAVYTSINRVIDVNQAAGIPSNYNIVFTNLAGKSWTATRTNNTYQVTVPVGYAYNISLVNANGFIISSGDTFNTTGITTPTTSHNISISGVSLLNLTGSIIGLGTSISNLNLSFIPSTSSGSIFTPVPSINTTNGTYSVTVEANVDYTVVANGVNDFNLNTTTVNINQNGTLNLNFSPKPVFPVTINTTGLSTQQQQDLQLTFTNINESGYSYTFSNLSAISLRNGTYSIQTNGLNNYPIEQALTSNLEVNNAGASKTINFKPVTVWSFNDLAINSTTLAYYKGLILNGQITTNVSSGHLTAKTGSSIVVPVQPNQRVIVSYYFTANFSIEGGQTITTATNSTNILESTSYVYNGSSAGTVTINVGGATSLTSYFPEIRVVPNVPYQENITVGVDKQYQTINDALTAASHMVRQNNERVNIVIDPGNYEEMLVVNIPSITLKNASTNPSIETIDNGVNIASNAVRITSYYGHGYHYYSMNSQNKWSQEVLQNSIENGTQTFNNAGAGTTNGSFWNATVVVTGSDFEAENIIFENSFNQYISQKESQDVLVPWQTGSPGVRPTNFGNMNVQQRIFVERAAAIAFPNNTQRAILKNCSVIGRQDSFFGGQNARVVVYKGEVMGAVDFIFGGMTAVFYQTKLTMNVSDASNDTAYITAAQQTSGRGYLMYECTVSSTNPNQNTNSIYRAKPGYFGRPWQANTSEVVFYNTTIETSNYPGFIGNSLIHPLGWLNTLGGTSSGMYEIGTMEESGVNNLPSRASWATTLITPILNDSTVINTFNFTKGNDNWDPIPNLIANDPLSQNDFVLQSMNVIMVKNRLFINKITEPTTIEIFNLLGEKYHTIHAKQEVQMDLPVGVWMVKLQNSKGVYKVKVISR